MRIVSGGQTGVDRAALDVAMGLHIPVGGFCPRGRRAEDGRVPDRYPLVELAARDYASRTAKNVEKGDATLVIYREQITPGSAFTLRICTDLRKPCHSVDLARLPAITFHLAQKWLEDQRDKFDPFTLNIAGSRESSAPGIYEEASAFLRALLAGVK